MVHGRESRRGPSLREVLLARGLLGRSRLRKFRNQPVEFEGHRFDSKAEAKHYVALRYRQRAGEVRLILRQVPFHLPGRVVYRVDFLVQFSSGTVEFHEVKGHRTEAYRIKKRQVEEIYGVRIQEFS